MAKPLVVIKLQSKLIQSLLDSIEEHEFTPLSKRDTATEVMKDIQEINNVLEELDDQLTPSSTNGKCFPSTVYPIQAPYPPK